ICKLCWVMVGSSGGDTTNLFNHLKRKHPKEHAESVSLKSVQPHSSVSHEVPKHKQLSLTDTLHDVGPDSRWLKESLNEQEAAISQVLKADKKARHLALTWQDIDVLESVKKALNPLKDFTYALSGEDYLSVSYLKSVLHLLKMNILSLDAEDTKLTNKENITQYLSEKYSDPTTDDLLDMVSLLDPRFKLHYENFADDTKHWLPIPTHNQFKALTLTYRCLNHPAPSYLQTLISPYIPSRPLHSSSVRRLTLPPLRFPSSRARSFSSLAPKW
ncbi:ZBED1 protein, partial [Amia calva]|nr:ZBED1 protein [Amia calva]